MGTEVDIQTSNPLNRLFFALHASWFVLNPLTIDLFMDYN